MAGPDSRSWTNPPRGRDRRTDRSPGRGCRYRRTPRTRQPVCPFEPAAIVYPGASCTGATHRRQTLPAQPDRPVLGRFEKQEIAVKTATGETAGSGVLRNGQRPARLLGPPGPGFAGSTARSRLAASLRIGVLPGNRVLNLVTDYPAEYFPPR